MSKPGRKRKAGPRTKSGRLSRAGKPRFDDGSEHAQAVRRIYGENCSDAVGRAFAMGLLHSDQSTAKAMLDTARRIFTTYWQAYQIGSINCTLGDHSGGFIGFDPVHAKRREQWLNATLATVKAHRTAFDQLVIDLNADSGPSWLDAIIADKRRGAAPHPRHMAVLARATEALLMVTR